MAATVASATFYSEDAASPQTASKPASTASGDLLVYAIAQGDSVLANLTAPAGWTATSSANGGSTTGKVWTKVAGGSEPSTYDFPYSSGADVAAVMIRVTDADTTPTLVQAAGTAGPNGGSCDSPTVTPTGSDDLLIVVMSAACGGTTLVETDPSGTTDLGQGQVAGGFQALAAAYQQLASGSATGAKTWTSITPATKPGVTFSLAIKSASGGSTVNGTATITGAGVLSATATQNATATPAGAGTLTAPAVQRASATPAGAGVVSAAVTQRSAASLAGAGALTAPVVQGSTAALTGAGTLDAPATQAATATLTGAGTLAATGASSGGATASLTGAGALTAAATQLSSSALAGAGAVTAAATQNGKAAPAGAGALTAAGVIAGAAALTGTGVLTSAVRQLAGASLTAAGVLSASAGGAVTGTAALAGAGVLVINLNPCTTPRPFSGTTTHLVTTTARPDTGITEDPC